MSYPTRQPYKGRGEVIPIQLDNPYWERMKSQGVIRALGRCVFGTASLALIMTMMMIYYRLPNNEMLDLSYVSWFFRKW